MVTLTERTIMKSRSGVYSDTAENRRKHRVGQKYGAEKQSDDGEKTEKKETDPAKELEAVNKVIAAINEGKMTLPAAEVMKLSEKKQKLEAAKKQAEKINAGVKANEEKKNAEEAKETSKKINEAQKKEAEKKESLKNSEENVLGDGSKEKELSLKNEDGDSMFIRVYKDGAVRVEDVNLRKDFKNTEEAWNWLKKEGYTNSETGGKETSEETEVYTRIKFDDVPNSGKINLKKYLSEKVRKGVDEKWSNIKNIPTENLRKMEKGLVNDLNKNFEAIKKSQRAELLYSIMKVKGELESRGKETSKEGSKESGKLSDLQSKVPGYMNMPEYKKYISAKSEVDNFGKVPSGGDKRQRYDELNEQLIEATKKYKEALKEKLTT